MKKWIQGLSLIVLLLFVYSGVIQAQENGKTLAQVKLTLEQDIKASTNSGVKFVTALKRLEEKFDISFMYQMELLEGVSAPRDIGKSENLTYELKKLLAPYNLKYTRLNNRTFAISFDFSKYVQKSNEQQLEQIQGTVTDAESGAPLPGVNVLIKGTTTGTSTDNNGQYELNVPSLQDTLVFSFIGYETQQVPINGRTEINVALTVQAVSGEELVVVGYGTQQRRDLTGSISSVSSEDLASQPTTSFDNALQGKLAGVRVVQSNGAPGGRTRIRIRGQNSVLGGSDPLYVVDGVPIISGSSGNTNLLASINPADIQSIDVLKDASATAIYGARGSNGVILITTKKGSQGQQRVDFETSFSFSEVENKLDLMNAEQFVEIANERARNDGAAEPFPNPGEVTDVNTDWMDEIFRAGFKQNYSLSTSGGDDNTRYAVSTNYTDEKGTIIGSDFSRGSLRLNLDQDVTPRLQVTPTLYVSRTQSERVNTEEGGDGSNVMINTFMAPPIMTPRDEEGNFTPGTELKQFPFSPGSGDNPVALALENLNRLTSDRILGNISAQYELADGLSVKILGGIDNVNNEVDGFTSRVLQSGLPAGEGSESRSTTTTFLNENTVNYQGTFGEDHRFNATAGFTWQKEESEFVNVSASNFVTDDLLNNNLGAGENFTAPNTGSEEWTLISWLGRVNYTLKDRYLFTFTGRIDGSSRFGEGNKYGTFPSAAFAWRISEEDFIQEIEQISNLKLRLSWGLSGNQAIEPFQSLQRMTPQQLVLGQSSSVGFAPANLGNPELQWETTEQIDVGVDLDLWEQRVRLSADYYYKDTSDLLALVNLPPSTGFGSILRNVGSVENKGVELELGADIVRGEFNWSVSGNISSNKNTVKRLARGADIIAQDVNIQGPANIIREGEPLSAFYGLQQDGLTENGLFNYVDQNEDGEVNNDDRVILGNPYPDFTYGLSMSFNYKGFSLSALIQGEAGKEVWNSNKERGAVSMHRGYNQLEAVVNRWRPDDPDPNAPFPRATSTLNANPSSFFVEDASFLRINNVRLSYTLPVVELNIPLRAATVYVSGQNLATFTDYSWFTPDVNSWGSGDLRIGVDRGSYPSNRSFTIGTQIGF
ncbi:TonB-dependent receptor [Aliifodinibius sp. S!AR15-10]|uniref:SusC/RagA family TonB-linked outer membrane protein n=1 Tax=Aliifodinibius sp. S!AR15-10 TaxID=2950437 RepID=UPI002866788B|nr:TonB-dependent receptor [Aliifodinibius sp. S!AR15-10]MDR8390378.1 TonB-dependent receptor [Aliifodinibius sp. S!AR15-10]